MQADGIPSAKSDSVLVGQRIHTTRVAKGREELQEFFEKSWGEFPIQEI
jgi:hypothetical protein